MLQHEPLRLFRQTNTEGEVPSASVVFPGGSLNEDSSISDDVLLPGARAAGPRERDYDTIKQATVNHSVCAQLVWKMKCIEKAFLRYERERPNEARTQFVLKTADKTFEGIFLAFSKTWFPTA